MVTVERILARIAELRDEHAVHALAKPRGKKGFDYGVASGRYLAFEDVRRAISVLLEEDARDAEQMEQDQPSAVAGILREE